MLCVTSEKKSLPGKKRHFCIFFFMCLEEVVPRELLRKNSVMVDGCLQEFIDFWKFGEFAVVDMT